MSTLEFHHDDFHNTFSVSDTISNTLLQIKYRIGVRFSRNLIFIIDRESYFISFEGENINIDEFEDNIDVKQTLKEYILFMKDKLNRLSIYNDDIIYVLNKLEALEEQL